MLVVSREKDQAMMIGDDLCVKVLKIRGKRALVMVSGRRVGAIWDESEPQWMEIEEKIDLGDRMACVLVDVRVEKARLGFEVPHGVNVHRKEVYDAIKQENGEDWG